MTKLAFGPPLPLPTGVTEAELRAFVESICVRGSSADELATYARVDFRRFAYTLGLAPSGSLRALELGANPYFTTMLVHHFTDLDVTLANGPMSPASHASQVVDYVDPRQQTAATVELAFDQFNVETERFPHDDASFDVVFFCEIIEHLSDDPLRALLEIRRVLKAGGTLILTTPNVARLENVARLFVGKNIYDPYSAYGPYGRHNREYTLRELRALLVHAGFTIDVLFSADVHANRTVALLQKLRISSLFALGRPHDLGQYLFVRATRTQAPAPERKPAFLYRSYPADQLSG